MPVTESNRTKRCTGMLLKEGKVALEPPSPARSSSHLLGPVMGEETEEARGSECP